MVVVLPAAHGHRRSGAADDRRPGESEDPRRGDERGPARRRAPGGPAGIGEEDGRRRRRR